MGFGFGPGRGKKGETPETGTSAEEQLAAARKEVDRAEAAFRLKETSQTSRDLLNAHARVEELEENLGLSKRTKH